jgi:hypothetical protein
MTKIFPTQVLVNSPMNDPAYREEHKIEIRTKSQGGERIEPRDSTLGTALVVSCSSFTSEDYEQMLRLRSMYFVSENYGVLRQVTRYVRHETGVREIDILERLMHIGSDERHDFPAVSHLVEVVPHLMSAPVSWSLLEDELRVLLPREFGVAEDSALDTVLTVQRMLTPAYNRTFPQSVELAHDYAAWHAAMLDVKYEGNYNAWDAEVPHLREFGPGVFVVEDSEGICRHGLGFRVELEPYGSWELESPVSRPVVPKELLLS